MSIERGEKPTGKVHGRKERKQAISENLARVKRELVDLVNEKRAQAEKIAAEKDPPFREARFVQPKQPVDTIELFPQGQPSDFTVTHSHYSFYGHDGLHGSEYATERTIARIENGQIITIYLATDYTFSATPSPTPEDIDQQIYKSDMPKLLEEESDQFDALARMKNALTSTPLQMIDTAHIDS